MSDMIQLEATQGISDRACYTEELENSSAYIEGQEVEVVKDQPSPKVLLLLIAIFLLPKALVAATWGRYIPLPLGLYMWWAELWLLVFASIVVIGRSLGIFSYKVAMPTRHWYLTPILLLGILQIISLVWNGRTSLERGYSFLQTVYMCAPVLTAVMLVSGLSYANRMKVVCGVVLLLTFVILVYLGLSSVFPGLRPSAAWMDRIVPGLGFIRVFGPLGPSTALNFVLFPTLGFTMGLLFVPGRSKAFWGFITFVIFTVIFGTGSRGAVLCMAAFFILMLVTLRMIKALKVVIPLALILGGVILFTGIPQRYFTMVDPERTETYKTALRTFSSRPRNVIVGTGHGGLYSLLHDNTLRELHGETRWYLRTKETKFGFTLTNSHSTYLQSLVETGLVGFVLLMLVLLWTLRRFLGRRYRQCRDPWTIQARLTLTGCVASMVLMITSVFFYNLPWLVFIWSIFVITAAETVAESSWSAEANQAHSADELACYSYEES